MTEENQIPKGEPTPDTSHESKQQRKPPDPPLSSIPAKSEAQPSEAHHEIAYKQEKHWLDKAKPFVELVGLILLAIYTCYTVKMYRANKEAADAAKCAADTASGQFTLTRQQIEFTQSAKVAATASPRYTNDMSTLESISFRLDNRGHEHATRVRANFVITERDTKTKRIIRTYPPFPIVVPYPLDPADEPGMQFGEVDTHHFELPDSIGIQQSSLLRIWRLQDFLRVDVDLHYFNGFEEVCKASQLCYLAYWNPRWINTTNPSSTFFACEDFDAMLPEIQRDAAVQEQYHKDHNEFKK